MKKKRFYAYTENVLPTVYALPLILRQRRCNIKSTALLDNIMHF